MTESFVGLSHWAIGEPPFLLALPVSYMDTVLTPSPHPPAIVKEERDNVYKDASSPDSDLSETVSVTFTVDDRVGMLKEVLEVFAANGISLATLESRPGATSSCYDFFVQFKRGKSLATKKALADLEGLESCRSILALSAAKGEGTWLWSGSPDWD